MSGDRRVLSFIFFGRAAILLSSGGRSVLIDPGVNLGLRLERLLGESNDLSCVIVSHEHPDHFDRDLVGRLASRGIPVLGSRYLLSGLSGAAGPDADLRIMRHGESVEVGGVEVRPFRAKHTGLGPFVVFVELGGISAFHGSDSGFTPSIRSSAGVDVAFLPAGGGSPTASVSESLRIARLLNPRWIVPIHGTRRELSSLAKKASRVLGVGTVVPEGGETVELPLGD